MKKILKETNQKGITLVALVITIIVLLILAGISISALTNQGLFTQAQNAKNLTEQKTAEENAILTNYLEQMNAIIGGQVTESIPDGAAVTPINDITTWLKTGGISKQYLYTTIEQVIADTTCTESLMNNENAMKYLERSTGFSDAICTNETAMTYLGQSPYVDDTVLNSDSWKSKIINSEYSYLVINIVEYGYLFKSGTDTYKYWTDATDSPWSDRGGYVTVTKESLFLCGGQSGSNFGRAYAKFDFPLDIDFSKYKYLTITGTKAQYRPEIIFCKEDGTTIVNLACGNNHIGSSNQVKVSINTDISETSYILIENQGGNSNITLTELYLSEN